MQETIYQLDTWGIIKLLGGIGAIITATVGFASRYLSNRLTQSLKYGYDQKLEDLKGQISKSNTTLNSLIQDHLSNSQKIQDKKLEAYETLWKTVLVTRNKFPTGIALVYQLFPDDWFDTKSAFKELNDNKKIGTMLRSLKLETALQPLIDAIEIVYPYKPYLSDKSYRLFHSFQSVMLRVAHMFIWEYQKGKVYSWKKDPEILPILKVALSSEEIEHIAVQQFDGLRTLKESFEHKILVDIRESLNIQENSKDTINYLKDIEELLKVNNKEIAPQ